VKSKKNYYYVMSLLIGLSVGGALGIAFENPGLGVSIGSGMGVFLGGLIEYSNNKRNKRLL